MRCRTAVPHHDVVLWVVVAATLEHLHHRCFPHASVSDNNDLGSKHQRRSVSCLHAADSALGRCRNGPRQNCVSPRHGFLRPREELWSTLSMQCGCPTRVTGRAPTQATQDPDPAAVLRRTGLYLSYHHTSTRSKNFHDQARVKTAFKIFGYVNACGVRVVHRGRRKPPVSSLLAVPYGQVS